LLGGKIAASRFICGSQFAQCGPGL